MCCDARRCITYVATDVREIVRMHMIANPDIEVDEVVAEVQAHRDEFWQVEFAGFIRDNHTSHLPSPNEWEGPEIETRESYTFFREHPEALREAA